MNSDGTKFIVGAEDEDHQNVGHADRGAAYIFTYSGGSWDTGARIINANGFTGDKFGHSVAMSSDGTKVIVGENYGRLNGNRNGAAHIFTYDASNATWAGVQIDPQSGTTSDRFGQSVAMSSDGTKVIVGAHRQDTGGSDFGAAYVFTYDGSSWSEQQKIQPSSVGSTDNQFGYGVAMNSNGTKIIVGARYEDSDASGVNTNASNSGAAYIYTYDSSSSSWGSEARIKASDAGSSDYFGESVAMDSAGTTVIVGAHRESNWVGAAYIYTYNGSTWSQQQKIQATSTTQTAGGAAFGYSVDVSGDGTKFIVGAYYEDTPVQDAGSAYIYTYDGSSWGNLSSSEVHVQASDQAGNAFFGYSVAMSSDGTNIIVGARGEDSGGIYQAGAAYFYHNNQITDSGFVFDTSTQVFTVTGTGIVSGSTVQLEGADGSLYSVVDATAPNAAGTQVTFKMVGSGGSTGTVYPDIDMTSASQGGYVVTAHTEGSGSEAMWKAFDGDSSSTYWKVDNGYSTSVPYSAVAISGVLPSFTDTAGTPHAGHWIQLELPNKIKLTRFVTAANFASQYFMKSYVVLGSNDNTSWTLLHSEANGTGVQDVTTLSGGSTSFFKYFKLLVKSKLEISAHLQVGEVEFYGILDDGRFEVAQQPYKVRINSTSGLIGTSTAKIGFLPTWTTAVGADLGFDISGSTTQTLVGTDGGGGTNRTFSVAPGSNALPAKVGGGTLDLIGSTGAITGQIAAEGTTPMTFRLTDNGSGLFTDREIDIVGIDGLYIFSPNPFKFTNGGQTGRLGPTLATLTGHADYSAAAWRTNTAIFNLGKGYNPYSGSDAATPQTGFQLWTVPKDGTYTIQAQGALGGDGTVSGNQTPGKGARVQADFALTKGTKIIIIVGQAGTGAVDGSFSGGGGGGTFVLKNNFTTSTNDIYLIAGGGQGTSEYGNNATSYFNANGSSQGTNSSGGSTGGNGSGGGAGWGQNGQDGGTGYTTFGRSVHNFSIATANSGLDTSTLREPGYGATTPQPTQSGDGGFGGGGSGYHQTNGGGGGYRGGSAGYYSGNSGYTPPASSWIMPNGTTSITVTNRTFLGNPGGTAAADLHGWVLITQN
jgi:hypothetical protein